MNEISLYTELKKKIIFLKHSPGSVLREKKIMENFAVSRMPVREALMRLEMDGLVRIIPHVGTFVADVGFQQLKDIFEVNSCLVGLAGQLAASRITEEEIFGIIEHVNDMRKTEDTMQLMQLDRLIHRIINFSTKNDVLAKTLNTLHDHVVRIWVFSGTCNDYWEKLADEHAEIASALERRDEKMTAELLENHTRRFVDNIRSQLVV